MIELYHYGFSVCSEKVRLVLAEKGLDYASREVDLMAGEQHDPEYVRLNPKHVVPTLVHEGRVLIESSLILRYLDEAFPEPPLRPADAFGRYEVDAWLHRVDVALHPAAPIVTFALGAGRRLRELPEAVRRERLSAIPDPAERAARLSAVERGIRAPELAGALAVFVSTLDRMEAALAERAWISGERFGLADVVLLPYALRLEHLGLDPLLDPALRPRVARWLAGVKERPSFAKAVAAWASEDAVAQMRREGERLRPELEPLLRAAPARV